MLLSKIANILGAEFFGEDREILSLNALDLAKESELSFCESEKHTKRLQSTKAGALILDKNMLDLAPKDCVKIVSKTPYLSFAIISKYFAKPLISKEGKDPIIAENCQIMERAYIGKDTKIGKNSTIMSGVYIGDRVEIGEDCVIYPNTTIYNDCKIGNRCSLHAGAVIGGDGFGYAHDSSGRHYKIYHSGNVVIEDDVEIGANSTIDRALFASTIIKEGTKIDNLVMIAHNCEIGQNSILAAQVGLSGSTVVGRNVVFGGQAGSVGHIKIGDFATIAARGGVSKSISGGKVYAGFPLLEHREWLKMHSKIARLIKQKQKQEV